MNLYALFNACLLVEYKKIGKSTNYALIRKNQTLYVFFESSNGVTDWKNNLDFPAKPYRRNCKTVWFAHRGFIKAWKEVEPIIASTICDRTIKQIIIAGYSHGGALAVLCHEYAWFNRPDIRRNVFGFGFGAPRVFWGVISNELKLRWENFTVIKNINDLVTRLPPATFGFKHVGKLIKIGKKGKYSGIEAHLPQNYLEELKSFTNNKKTDL